MGGVSKRSPLTGPHSTMFRMTRQGAPVISLGPFLRFYHESMFCEALKMTPRQFRAWLRCLGVPAIELKGGRYVEHTTFALCLLASLRCVSPSLHPTPGSPSRSSRKAPPPPPITGDLAAVLISQLTLASHVSERMSRSAILRMAHKSANHLALAGYTPEANRSRADRLARRRAMSDPVVSTLTEALHDDPAAAHPPA